MIGMDYFYADQQVQCPSRRGERRAPSRGLVDDGFGDRLLLSQDVFLKMMLTRYGGFGYGYILKHFVPRLKRHGVDQDAIERMLVDNPRARLLRRTATPGGACRMTKTDKVLLAGESWVSAADPLQGLRPVRSRDLPPRRRAAGRGAGGQRLRRSRYMPAHEAATAFPVDAGGPDAL